MLIKELRVKNFRCILDEKLDCEDLTVLIGPNGSGKSSFLVALYMFYQPAAAYGEDDFYDKDTSQDISITVTFTDLTPNERQLFRKYIEGGRLTVQKVIMWPRMRGSQKYYGMSFQNPEFDAFRSASGSDLRAEYDKLREEKYPDLPTYTNKNDAEVALQSWEESNADRCIRRRDKGQFFGFREVGESRLERFTRYISVPAVRDACEDAAEGKGTSLTEIMDLVVRSALSQRKEITELQKDTQQRYEQIVDPAKLEELRSLEKELSTTLKTYVPDAGVELAWLTDEVFEIPMPKADIRLVEDEYPASVERTGHGLQRAFIMTMLQHLAVAQSYALKGPDEEQMEGGKGSTEKTAIEMPNLIIGIEEPELYQHPNRQRHLSKILLKLATGSIKGVAERTQIIYSTHSPLFVDITRFDKVRALMKTATGPGRPRQTRVIDTTLDKVASVIERAHRRPKGSFSAEALRPRLQTLMTPWMNEGFFANVAVLVEGEEDRAAILGTASALGSDLESLGVSVIPCMGKTNLDRPAAIFMELEIPVYVIWDSDVGGQSANPEENHRLLRLLGQPEQDWPEMVSDQFACFESKLSVTLRKEIGEALYDGILEECCRDFHMVRRKYALKNPLVVKEIIDRARSQGKASGTLEKIVSSILALRETG